MLLVENLILTQLCLLVNYTTYSVENHSILQIVFSFQLFVH